MKKNERDSKYMEMDARRQIYIAPSDKIQKLFRSKRCDRETAYRDIANQISLTLYKKTYGTSIYGALGTKQNIKKNDFRNTCIRVNMTGLEELPEKLGAPAPQHRGGCRVYSGSRHQNEILRNIDSMIAHARSNDIEVKVLTS